MCGLTKLYDMTAGSVSQFKNKNSTYDELLQRIRNENETRAKRLIPELCYTLQKEDSWLSKEDIKDRVKKDLVDIWSLRTITKYIPDEFKDEKKQDARTKDKKKVGESIDEALHQKALEQSIIINGSTETSIIDPHPLAVAQHMQQCDKQHHDDTIKMENNALRKTVEKQEHEIEHIKAKSSPTMGTQLIVTLDLRKLSAIEAGSFRFNVRGTNVFRFHCNEKYEIIKIS